MPKNKKSSYYDVGGISALDILKAKLTPEQLKGYYLGTSLMYHLRANFKDTLNSNITKAKNFLDELYTLMKSDANAE